MKNRIENCNLKTTIRGALCGALNAIIIVSFILFLTHIAVQFNSVKLDNYSLVNRFKTAYCFNVPDAYTYYYSAPVIYDYVCEGDTTRERYMASPYITYGLIILGSVTGVILARRRKNNKIKC